MLYIFFFNDTATTEIYTLSLHDALPIYPEGDLGAAPQTAVLGRCLDALGQGGQQVRGQQASGDRKSTRLNSSHANISYAVFCLKKKNNQHTQFLLTVKHIKS